MLLTCAVHGRGAASITRILVEEKVPTPGWLNYERYGTFANIFAGAPAEKAYAWTIAQVKSILKEETYIGHSIHNKQSAHFINPAKICVVPFLRFLRLLAIRS